jgi:hypothetical protein
MFTQTLSYKKLQALSKTPIDLRTELTPERLQKMVLHGVGFDLFYGTERVSQEVLDALYSLTAEKREKQCVLKMEKLARMSELAKNFQDESLKKAVSLYVENFDQRLAQSWDLADLNALANGKIKPSSSLEEQVAALLVRYQEKFSDLTKKFIL